MKADTILAAAFGALTLLATIAGVRYKSSICGLVLKFFRCGRRRRDPRSIQDVESTSPELSSNQNSHSTGIELLNLPPVQHPMYLDWPVLPSPYDETRREQHEWSTLA
ncbi:hypothetical protein BU16DRAFT_566069 [Lophium mytilinum]|uniref:Uncharacterized protein n=1 Tax=Lophium mytilinum TaxID=390894 RepID=A0A6A6QI69_9PEZI|nr:hypothetical protein BU16DRAFT_566069 [Lophium mytilinum]